MRLDLIFIAYVSAQDPTPGAALIMKNSVPILPQAPGYAIGGGLRKIRIDGCYDLLCDPCNAFHPIFDEFLGLPVSDAKNPGAKTYRNLVTATFNFFPLPYHPHSWIANKMTPYLIEQCRQDAGECRLFKYMEWLRTPDAQDPEQRAPFEQILDMEDQSEDSIVFALVFKHQFVLNPTFGGLDQTILDRVYDPQMGHDWELDGRAHWKWCTAMGTAATPSLYVNNQALNDVPFDPQGWKALVDTLIANQDQMAFTQP